MEAIVCGNPVEMPDQTNRLRDYHRRPELSHSQLEVFRGNPARYYGRFITKTIADERTEEMEFGSLFHDFMLLDGANIVEVPPEALTKPAEGQTVGQRRGKAWKEFVAAHADKELIMPGQWQQLRGMRDAMMAAHDARKLLEFPGENEYVTTWQTEAVDCRACLDRYCPQDGLIVDLKTSKNADPKAFAAESYRLGYHRQAAWYQDAVASLTGDDLPFLFVVVEKKPPYRVEVIELDEEFVDLGWRQNEEDLRRWKACRESGIWHAETWGTAITVGVPRWAKYEREWEFAHDE